MPVSIKVIGDKERAEIAEFIRIGIGWGITAPFSCADHMRIHHGVFFENINLFTRIKDTAFKVVEWGFTPEGLIMQEWIDGNVSGKYAIQSHHVYFEDYDDALLCYLRFKD